MGFEGSLKLQEGDGDNGGVMKTEHLYYFKCLAEVLNYTQASQKLYIGQPTLSSAIKNLENEIGAMLFVRNKGSHIELTEAGVYFYNQVTLALQNLEKGINMAQEASGSTHEVIRLGTLYCMQGRAWSQALNQFKQQCDINFRIEIEHAYSPELIRKLRSGALDVAFASHVPGDTDMRHVFCRTQPLVLGVHVNHPLAKRESVSLADLQGERIYTYAESSPVTGALEELINKYDLTVRQSCFDEVSMSSLVAADENNVALFCYSFLCDAFDEVVCIPVSDVPADFHKIYMVYKRDQHQLRVVQEFIDFMSEFMITDTFKELSTFKERSKAPHLIENV